MEDCSKDVLDWYDANKRTLPWRDEVSLYRTLVSEFMLQQTRVETVKPYFARFMKRFPTLNDLANAPTEDVLQLWKGLGYYSRAHNLHKSANILINLDKTPENVDELRQLPGVGEYLAGAIASIALDMDEAAVDGNHHRIFSRLFCDSGSRKEMWKHARKMLPHGRAGDFNQALMDIGSKICRAKNPLCCDCPITKHCQAYQTQTIDNYPPKKKKKIIPTKHVYSAFIKNDSGQVLVVQRPNSGLYRGLFELPSFFVNSSSNFQSAFHDEFALLLEVHESFGYVEHRLTHMHLVNHLYSCSINTDIDSLKTYLSFRWILGMDEVPLSTLAQKVYSLSQQDQQLSLFPNDS